MTGSRKNVKARAGAPFAMLDRRRLSLRFRKKIPSTTQAIQGAVAAVMREAKKGGCVGDGKAEMEIALREALANAVIHGNRGAPEKSVLLRCYCDPEVGLLIAIRDQGAGFLPEEVPDPRSAERIQLSHGRGLFLMRELMDHMEHRKGGREVVLYKKAPEKTARARSRAKR